MNGFCTIDDKLVPLYRIVWVAALPHFCGSDDCAREGQYEVQLERADSVWAVSIEQRDEILAAVDAWQSGLAD